MPVLAKAVRFQRTVREEIQMAELEERQDAEELEKFLAWEMTMYDDTPDDFFWADSMVYAPVYDPLIQYYEPYDYFD